MSKSLKNFSNFLKENWTDKLEEFVDDVVEDDNVSDNNISGDEMENVSEEETEAEDAKVENEIEPTIEPSVEHTSTPSINTDKSCKVVFLSGVVSTIGKENANAIISTKLKDKLCSDGECKEVQLFQLNIQPASEGDEPMDGMVQVYDVVKDADAIIVCSDLKKGQISSVLQTTLERLSNHFKSKELRNKVFGSVITGDEDSHQSIKSSLLNFANNMGMIVGGDCNVFCCISEGETLGDCGHDFEADTTCSATCIKELCYATSSIRSTVETATVVPSIDIKPTAISTILNFDNFENKEETEVNSDDLGYDDDGEEEEDDTEVKIDETPTEDSKLNNFDEFDGEEENFEDDASDEKSVEEEEEGYYYDYNNNICHNRTETPMTKPNPVKLTKESKGCGKKSCGNCKCKKTNESTLLNFSKFMNKKRK